MGEGDFIFLLDRPDEICMMCGMDIPNFTLTTPYASIPLVGIDRQVVDPAAYCHEAGWVCEHEPTGTEYFISDPDPETGNRTVERHDDEHCQWVAVPDAKVVISA